jgi:hypothetical protein
MRFSGTDRAAKYRDIHVDPAVASKVMAQFEPGTAAPTNLEDLCLRLSLKEDDAKAILHWLIDSRFMKRSMRLPGFRFYPRKKAKQEELFEEP